MVMPTPRYALCRISGEMVEDGIYGCVVDLDEMLEMDDPFGTSRSCSCKRGECKAPGQQPTPPE